MNEKNKKGRREMPDSKYKTNEKIRCPEVRVVEGLPNSIYRTSEAIKRAEELDLDLVMINETANPPICKIVNFGKFVYQERQKEKERKDKQFKVIVKEVQFSPNIGENDYETKKKNVIKFLQKENKVKATVFFKGRSIMFKDQGELILAKLATEVSEYGTPEALPKMMGKNMTFIIKPKKNK